MANIFDEIEKKHKITYNWEVWIKNKDSEEYFRTMDTQKEAKMLIVFSKTDFPGRTLFIKKVEE